MNPWTARFSERMAHVRASEIRELLKLLGQPDILSFAGGIPDPALFPTARIAELYAEVLADTGPQALPYSVSEGYAPLRRWIATDPRPNTLRLSYALPRPDEIDEGVCRLARVIGDRLAYAGANIARAATGRA